jgi:S-adenosylmethionine decarboxylase
MESENHFSENPLVETCSPASETQAGEQLDKRKDYFKERAGVKFAGVHLIIDCIGAKNLDCLEKVELCLRDAIKASGATLLHIHLHHFTPNGGISGVAVLAESHISIHSWPENGYAALDVFMCGSADPHKTLDVIKAAFEPDELRCNEILRGKDVL